MRGGHPDFLDLPWGTPLADWDHERVVPMAHGISRHVVRFVRYDRRVYAIKETAEAAAEAVKAHLASQYVGRKADALLFPAAHTGGHMQPSALYRHWYKARTAAGREDLRWHDLRHSGAVLAAQTGATLAELMARLGHSTPQAAMRYQHAAQGRDQVIAAALSAMVESAAGGSPTG